MQLSSYLGIADMLSQVPYNGQFAVWEGTLMKSHPEEPDGHLAWRPVTWCDRCRKELGEKIHYDPSRRVTLCLDCHQPKPDKFEAQLLGIFYDG